MRSPWYTTINGAVIAIRLVALFILVFLVANCFIGSTCKVQDVGLHIAFFCVLPTAISLIINPVRKCLATHFPISCGHRRCIFTGQSSRTLQAILLDIDKDIPSVEQLRRIQNQASIFLDDVKDELEKAISTATFECIFSGSVVERFGIPSCHKRGDKCSALDASFDVMFCPESDNASFSGQKGNVLVELIPEGDGYTSYAQLRPVRPRCEGDLVSSRNIRRNTSSAINGTKITHLPKLPKAWYNQRIISPRVSISSSRCANKINVGGVYHVTIMVCIKCCEWPPPSDWPTRKRYWPSQEDVSRIVSHGCHLVAKPAPFDKEQTSWRFSFSVAEVELSKLVPNTARKCFLALKIILKDHLQPVVAEFTSYHLKTIFLNALEKTRVDFWVDENIEECFSLLMNEIHDALVRGKCLHHWFKTVDLFLGMRPKKLNLLAWKIKKILENPAPYIFDDGSCCVLPCLVEKPTDPHTIDVMAEFGDVSLDIVEENQQSSQSLGQRPRDGDVTLDIVEENQQSSQSLGQRPRDGDVTLDIVEEDQQSSQSLGQRPRDGDVTLDIVEEDQQSSQSLGQRPRDEKQQDVGLEMMPDSTEITGECNARDEEKKCSSP